ncbi:MAG: sporulation initiation factor Spo0A C-terminal domain-containing protein [Oscillospiraceae bacterium]|nr:sporulation initiation factor Spo0A C-terminal domain-containing protein [Oscillospiraceae bacterium]MBQ7130623.1 sporulation initiation factor Spo0A C-terminal domain-containing protein [Oscillospiraceae bacterium]
MTPLEKQVDALMRLCTACDEETKKKAREEIRYLLQGRPSRGAFLDPEYQIRQILLELGAPDHLLGHPYAVQAVLLVIQDRVFIDQITFRLYPQLAAQFDTTASRVERAIRHLIEVTWTRGDLDILNHYFGSIVHPEKGKPTNGEFIARLANIVKQRLREGQ